MKTTYSLLAVIPAFLQMVMVPTCSGASDPTTQSVSLETAETLHRRLNIKCGSAGVVALYQGALAYRFGLGATPRFYPGRWDVYPFEKLMKDDYFVPELANENNRLFWIQIMDRRASDSTSLIVCGETVEVSVHGLAKTWRFPRAPEVTIQSLLESCADKYWEKPNKQGHKDGKQGVKTGSEKAPDKAGRE
jgi:hypothetical protein